MADPKELPTFWKHILVGTCLSGKPPFFTNPPDPKESDGKPA